MIDHSVTGLLNLCKDNTLLSKIINIKQISLFYAISRKLTLRIAKIEGIAYMGFCLYMMKLADTENILVKFDIWSYGFFQSYGFLFIQLFGH